ncbi:MULTISPECIES: ABC transporter permease subunit [Porcipelethomonas]|mgnify:FL=1|jgi:ABC-2 type transport system permease protein|uniref:ABC transporter permease subunit n=1 Tax=Porcipelethomonas TaxID=2981643 RepID=UPI0008229E7E|nr:ABC transporter permease subunit [Porcipelethomonas ammoniilytica]MBS6315287.1 ABC transporter permease subunit [Ruminococcus sp.]MEE0185485.1 ABC transporter permease [Oscillospiraceae bacterium]OLA69844.1 MAG: ABC transporter [Ruminococcus sp. 37_24]SCI97051.1 ABC-type transport system involved in multi-copper enzyme maturation%2C permease component [uncultured Ruminococcus sp.]MCU6719924.1 ABC transporter permease subunit [Porcipelethomonas ammoniilytica]
MSAIFRRELGAFFTSGIAYVFLAVFYLLAGLFFYMYTLSSSTTDMSGMFSMLFAVIIFLIPILTMKSFSEEKKQKTEQGLLTAPVGLGGIVLGKYFATILMYIFGVSIVLIYALIISYFGSVDWGILFSNYLALILLGAAFIAIGMFISSLTENQVVAAVGGICSLLFLCLVDILTNYISIDFITDFLNSISFYNKYYEFTCGIFNLSSVLFYISTAVIFNFLTVRVFEKRRWS